MSKKKIIIITILIMLLIIAILVIIGINNMNKEVKEVNIEKDIETSEQQNPNQNNPKKEDNKEEQNNKEVDPEITPITQEEYEQYQMETRLTDNRSLSASPTYEFKSDEFETIPTDPNWFKVIVKELSGGAIIEDLYKDISNVEVYNLKDTKTNFIIVTLDDQIFIYQMYKSEATHELTYEIFNANGQEKEYAKLISEKCTKLLSKKNPDSLNIGQW